MFKNVKKEVLLLCILLIPLISAQEYYADIIINVESAGFVTITGNTNHPDLLVKNSQMYTTKKQNYWVLQIIKNEIFSDFVYMVNLPPDASINYVKSSGSFRIEEGTGNLVITGYGQNKTFSIVVQYEIHKRDDFNGWYIIVPIVIICVLILFFMQLKKKKQSPKEIPKHNLKVLSVRQKHIVKLLMQQKKPFTQAQIQEMLKIPKASVSRNIRTLELKGIIEKEKAGMSNVIRLR